MRYSIEGFSQEYAMTLKRFVERKDRRTGNNKLVEIKIDCTDLVILRWFVDFYPNMKKMIIDGKEYAWIAHNKLVEDLPLIDISKEAFNERMKKLVEFKILGYQFVKEGGSFSLYCFGDNYINLVSKQEGKCSNTYGVDVQTDMGVSVQTPNKDSNINNKEINIDNIKYIVDFLNEKAKTNYRYTTPKTKTLINARLKEGFSVDDFKKVIEKKCQDWLGTEFEQYLRPETLFGNKFENYLNSKIINKKQNNNDFTERKYTKEELNSLFDTLDDIEI